MAEVDPRFPYGFRMESVRRVLKDGTVKVYQAKRPCGPPRSHGKRDVRTAVLAMNTAEAEALAQVAAQILADRNRPMGTVGLVDLVAKLAALSPEERAMVADMTSRMTPSPEPSPEPEAAPADQPAATAE